MNIQRAFSIRGVGKYVPKRSVLSSDIEKEIGLPENWIFTNIGVQTRYHATEESNTIMGKLALELALKNAELLIDDIDCLIAASTTFDYVIPNRSSLIKNAFEEAEKLDFPCIDINTVCTSFITALDYASMLFATSKIQNVAIVTSEISSKGLNPGNPETYSLFGDAAAAIIVSRTDQNRGLIQYISKTYSKEAKATIIEGGGNVNHPKHVPYDPALHSFKMDGKNLLRSVQYALPKFLDDFFKAASSSLAKIDLIVPHQASKLGLRMLTNLNDGNSDNIVDHLKDYGNCIAASIPLALVISIENGRLEEGDSCFLLGTAAGITIGGLLFTYSKF